MLVVSFSFEQTFSWLSRGSRARCHELLIFGTSMIVTRKPVSTSLDLTTLSPLSRQALRLSELIVSSMHSV